MGSLVKNNDSQVGEKWLELEFREKPFTQEGENP